MFAGFLSYNSDIQKIFTQGMSDTAAQVSQPAKVDSIILRIKIQQMIKTWKKKARKSRHRVNILKEWELTEKAYIEDLKLIINRIQEPLIAADILSLEDDRILFPNLNSMLKLSEELLSDIQGFLKDWNPHRTLIGKKLIQFHKGFIIYREYCNSFYKGQAILKKAKQDVKYQAIQAPLPMDFESYIIKPVQRPPKYQLLLREYLKVLPPTHADYKDLQIAIEKYQAVNEQNNQSMELQIRSDKMVQLDNKYGGIIKTSRVYLTEETAGSLQFKVRVVIFNDMILILRIVNEHTQEGFKKIYLSGESFVEAPMDGKYFINKLFICGIKENIHLTFFSAAERDRIHQTIKTIIHELYRKETNRASIRKKNKSKMNVFSEIDVRGQPMLRITVVGMEKRPTSSINLANETYYILKITAPFPNIQFQYSYLLWEELLQLQKELKSKNKLIVLPVLDEHPQSMSYYDIKKNKTKIIEYRQIYIERFLNYLFRSEQLEQSLVFIARSIKINDHFWSFLNYHEPCSCEICLNSSSLTLQEFEQNKSFIQSTIFSRNSITSQNLKQMNFDDSLNLKNVSSISFKEGDSCLFNSFVIPSKIINNPVEELDSLCRRLMWLDSAMGRIDYSFLPKNQQQEKSKKLKVTISIQSLKEDEVIHILISKTSTVQEVLEYIAASYQIETMRDFGLFLEYQSVPRLIDRDEQLWEVLTHVEYEFEQVVEKSNGQGFWRRLNSLRKWGEEMLTGKKCRLYLQKYIFVEDHLEIQACEDNPQRYSLLVEEAFYRFKKQILILNVNDMKKLCALYYILSSMDKLAHLCETNFRIDKLKYLMPESRWHLLQDSMTFSKDVYMEIEQYISIMERSPSRSNSQNIFSKVEIIYGCVLSLIYNVVGWNTLFFDVVNYDPPTLPGECTDLLLGINRKSLIIMRHKQLAPLVEIPLTELKYKVTVFSIFIETTERVLRFDGRVMYDIKKLIQMYLLLSEKFDPKPCEMILPLLKQ